MFFAERVILISQHIIEKMQHENQGPVERVFDVLYLYFNIEVVFNDMLNTYPSFPKEFCKAIEIH